MADNKKFDLTKGIPLKYGRTGTIALVHGKCDITGETTWCVEMDTSGEEYGSVKVSIKHLNKELEKQPPVVISKIDLNDKNKDGFRW